MVAPLHAGFACDAFTNSAPRFSAGEAKGHTMTSTPRATNQAMIDTEGASHQRRRARRVGLLAVAAIASAFSVIGAGPTTVQADDPFVPVAAVPLGLVATFGILSPAAVGNAAPEPATVIRGDVGVGGALTGFPPGLITGAVYSGAAAVSPMMTDLHAAYDNAAARAAGTPLPAVLGGTTLGPGVHTTGAAAGTAASTSFTIDGEGHADAVFIFQVGGALDLGANTTINLINGAQAKNVYWQVVGAGNIGANTRFVGTLIAGTAVDSGAGSTINGRLTSLAAAVTMSSTQLYSTPPSVSIDGGPAAYSTSSTPLITGVTSARSPMTVVVSIDGAIQTPSVTPSSGRRLVVPEPAADQRCSHHRCQLRRRGRQRRLVHPGPDGRHDTACSGDRRRPDRDHERHDPDDHAGPPTSPPARSCRSP